MTRPWNLCFPGWARIGMTDGALAVLAPHIPQIAGLLGGAR